MTVDKTPDLKHGGEFEFSRLGEPLRSQEAAAMDALPKALESNQKLREALGNISRMRCFLDPATNRTTLAAAILMAKKALGEPT